MEQDASRPQGTTVQSAPRATAISRRQVVRLGGSGALAAVGILGSGQLAYVTPKITPIGIVRLSAFASSGVIVDPPGNGTSPPPPPSNGTGTNPPNESVDPPAGTVPDPASETVNPIGGNVGESTESTIAAYTQSGALVHRLPSTGTGGSDGSHETSGECRA